MSMLLRCYPGDEAVGLMLTAILGVAIISTAAWLLAWCFRGKGGLRHFVLFSALVCCLAFPAIAWLCSAAGLTLMAVPIASEATPLAAAAVPEATVETSATGTRPPIDPPRAAIQVPTLPDERAQTNRVVAAAPGSAKNAAATDLSPSGVEQTSGLALTRVPFRGIALAIMVVWAAGVLLMLARLARNCGRVVLARRVSHPAQSDRLRALGSEIAARLGMREVPLLLVSSRTVIPLAAGFGRPAVILPERLLEAFSDDELRDVLAHEIAHLARGDQHVVLLQEFTAAIYWPIVSVHALNRELRRASEELCDNVVLAGRSAIGYGETLLHVAELLTDIRIMRAGAGIFGARGELERRVAGLIDPRRNTRTTAGRTPSLLVLSLLIALGAIPATTRFAASAVAGSNASLPADNPAEPGADIETERAAFAQPDDKPKTTESNRTIVLHGKVLGPGDRPIAGARLYVSLDEWTDPIELGVSDANGSYRLSVPEKTLRRTVTAGFPYTDCRAALIAAAAGFGSGWAELLDTKGGRYGEMKLEYAQTFHLATDLPIAGKIVDLGGNPVAGAVVNVNGIFDLADRRWWKMHPAIKAGNRGLLRREEIDTNNWGTLLYPTAWKMIPAATTDAEGRFTIAGAGADRAVRLHVGGPGIRSSTVSVITRDDVVAFTGAIRAKYPRARRPNGYFYPARKDAPEGDQGVLLFGPAPTIEVDPARTISGIVRDASTGEPIAGLDVRTVDGLAAQAVTDKQGRYRILRAEAYASVLVYTFSYVPDRYLTVVRKRSSAKELGEIVADFDVPRGVIISGRVLEAGTQRPIVSAPRHGCHDTGPGPLVAGNVVYFPLANNTGLRGKPTGLYFEGFPTGSQNYPLYAVIAPDGRYRIAVPPGPGVLFVQSSPGMPMFVASQTWKESEGLHRLFPYATLSARTNDGVPGGDAHNLPGFAGPIPITKYHAYRVIDPPADAKAFDLTLTVPRLPSRLLRFVRPDGRPIRGVKVRGLTGAHQSMAGILEGSRELFTVILEGSDVEILGLRPGRPREVIAASSDGKYAAGALVEANDTRPMTIRLRAVSAPPGGL